MARGEVARPHIAPSASDEWGTPLWLLGKLGRFDLDPAANAEHHAADRWYSIDDDGLSLPWFGRVFVNPPYGRRGEEIYDWIRKARRELDAGRVSEVVMLLPSKTGTQWFRLGVWPAVRAGRATIDFLPGRLAYLRRGGAPASIAPFASLLVTYRIR